VLVRFRYHLLKRDDKGVIRRYIRKVTGYSRSQVSRLIAEHKRTGQLKKTEYRRHRFPHRYTLSELELLARTAELHGWLSGAATKKIMEREYEVYGNAEFGNICPISVAHICNLRRSNIYRVMTRGFSKTKLVVSKIGERAKPDPKGQPGYIRIDTIHQGDIDGQKGVYHINAVDEITQWEIVASVERISEAYLVPVLESILAQFPFVIRDFHSDNGSEFVNHILARLLNKLLIRFIKSGPGTAAIIDWWRPRMTQCCVKPGIRTYPQACAERKGWCMLVPSSFNKSRNLLNALLETFLSDSFFN